MVHFADRALERRFDEFCRSLPPVPDEHGPLPMDSDFYISQLADALVFQKQLAKWKRTKIVFVMPGARDGEYRTVTFKPGRAAEAEAYVRQKYPTATVL